jgi:hypothetical protein
MVISNGRNEEEISFAQTYLSEKEERMFKQLKSRTDEWLPGEPSIEKSEFSDEAGISSRAGTKADYVCASAR